MNDASKESILHRVLSASQRVVLVHGPAACGKTTLVLDMYRHFVLAGGKPACMIIAPGAAAKTYLVNKLLESSSAGMLVSPAATTFDSLAAGILAHANPDGRMISPFWRHMLLRRIVDELAREGQLAQLSAVADTQGLVPMLDEVISELKRAATDPLALANAAAMEGKTGDILKIYTRYQQHLQETNQYDVEGQLWLARDALGGTGVPPVSSFASHVREQGEETHGQDAHAAVSPFADLSAVAVDGFTDFTPTQLDMLALIAGLVPRMVITLPWASDGRQKMWHWTGRTLDRIRARLGDIAIVPMVAQPFQAVHAQAGKPVLPDAPPPPALRHLCDTIFDYDAPPMPVAQPFQAVHPRVGKPVPPNAPPPGLSVVAAPGIDAEIAHVAAAVKRLLAAGAPSGSIAVLLRNPQAYLPHVERIFGERGIAVPQARHSVTDCPAVRFAIQVAGLGDEDFPAAKVLSVIKNSYFSPAAIGQYDAATVAAAEAIIRQGNVLSGRESYAKAARRLAARAREHDDELAYDADESPADVARPDERLLLQAAQMLDGLFELARSSASAQGLAGLIERLRLAQAAAGLGEPELAARDLRAICALSEALAGITREWDNWPHLRQAIACIESPSPRGEAMVDAISVLDARPLRYEHVFILGASERQLPCQAPENSLLGEADRAQWSAGGLALDMRGDLTAREMLLFYLAISRADKSLCISYVESGSSPSDSSAGSFTQSLLERFGGVASAAQSGLLHKISPGQLIPPAADLATPHDAVNAAVAAVFDSNPQSTRSSPAAARNPQFSPLAWVAANAPAAVSRVAAGLWARHRRWSQGQCDQFDGRITDADLLAGLSHRFGHQAVFSASQIDAYNQCPWHFFARYVLDLQELDWPQKRLEPITRGLFIHKVLFRLFVALRDKFGVALAAMPAMRTGGDAGAAQADGRANRRAAGPLIGVNLAEIPQDALLCELDAAIKAQSLAGQGANPPFPVLWDAQLATMRQHLRQYILDRRDNGPPGCASVFFELSFGGGQHTLTKTETPAGDAGIDGSRRSTDRPSADVSRSQTAKPSNPTIIIGTTRPEVKSANETILPGSAQGQPEDPASRPEPVSIATPEGPVLLAGRIDRVDYFAGPWGEGTMVVDYKTGALPSARAIKDNRRLQLPLYVEAIEALTGIASVGGALHAVGDELAFRYYSWLFPKETDPATLAQLRLGAMARVGEIVRSIRQGQFDLAPREDCRGCEYRRICHYSQARCLVKSPAAKDANATMEETQ